MVSAFRFFFQRERARRGERPRERWRKRERERARGRERRKKYCLYHKTLSEISGLVKRPWLEYEWWEKSRVVRAEAGERISPTVPASATAGKSNTVETPPLKPSDDKIREECSRIGCGDKRRKVIATVEFCSVTVSRSVKAKQQGQLEVRRVFCARSNEDIKTRTPPAHTHNPHPPAFPIPTDSFNSLECLHSSLIQLDTMMRQMNKVISGVNGMLLKGEDREDPAGAWKKPQIWGVGTQLPGRVKGTPAGWTGPRKQQNKSPSNKDIPRWTYPSPAAKVADRSHFTHRKFAL